MRYEKNGIFTAEDMQRIRSAHVCVVGCGGLGGYIIEMLARAGIGHLTVVDGDVFDESNLNRQLLSEESNIGCSKAVAAAERVRRINSEVSITVVPKFLTVENAKDMLNGYDLIMDALDTIEIRRILEKVCAKNGTPFVHGAIAGWYGQVCTILPGDATLENIYPEGLEKGVEQKLGNPSFTPALVASIQVSEALKLLTENVNLLRSKLLLIDLMRNTFETVDL